MKIDKERAELARQFAKNFLRAADEDIPRRDDPEEERLRVRIIRGALGILLSNWRKSLFQIKPLRGRFRQ